LTAAEATYQSLYGEIASRWKIEDGTFLLTITVPANTTAAVAIPAAMGRQVTEQGQALEVAEGVTGVRQEQEATFIEVGSGTYTFSAVPVTVFS
jgi:alpha-L-rhamnosidase